MWTPPLVGVALAALLVAAPALGADPPAVDPAVAATPAATPSPAEPAPAAPAGYKPVMWPEDQSWPKGGAALALPLLGVTAHLPKGSPNTYQLQSELPGDGRDSHMTRLVRTSGGPDLRIEIRFTGMGILDPCADYWVDFAKVDHFDRPANWPPRFETKMGRVGGTVVACLGLKLEKRQLYSAFHDVKETSTHVITTVGRKYQTTASVGAAFEVTYAGDFNSADFATIAADLEAIAGAVQEEHGQSGNAVAEAYLAFATLGGLDKASGATGETLYGAKIRTDLTPYRGFPYAVMMDMGFWGGAGNGWLGELKLGLGLGYFIADLVAVSVHATGAMGGGFSGDTNKIPLMWSYGASASAAVNIGQSLRVRGYAQPSILGGEISTKDTKVKYDTLKGKGGLDGFDEMTWGGQVEWSPWGRSAANGGSKGSGAAFYLGFEHRDQWFSSMNGIFIGYGAATGSFKAPPIDPLAEPRRDPSFFQK